MEYNINFVMFFALFQRFTQNNSEGKNSDLQNDFEDINEKKK